MSTLVFNAGSSSLKFAVLDEGREEELVSGTCEGVGCDRGGELVLRHRGETVREAVSSLSGPDAVERILGALSRRLDGSRFAAGSIRQVGHRVVHGGERFQAPTVIDKGVKASISELASLAPQHNPAALKVIEAAMRALPDARHVAVFDTAFHATLPPKAFLFPLPYDWYEDWGIRRFGFHGISHEWCALRGAELLGTEAKRVRTVSCHLGNGCSATATESGVAVATTMGFTPVDGLMMGSRSGAVDPGLLLFLLRSGRLNVEALDRALNEESGLRGVSGVSSDFRELERSAEEGNARASLALEMFADRVRSSIASLAAMTAGTDAVTFTGGIGENSASLRSRVCDGLAFMGVRLDKEKNRAADGDADIAAPDSAVRVLVVRAQEERLIARETVRVLNGA